MGSTTEVVLDSHCKAGPGEVRNHKSVKRVSFHEDDLVVIIPNNEDLDKTKMYTATPRRIPGPKTSTLARGAAGIVRLGPNGSLKPQTQRERRWIRAGETGSLKTTEKQVKSILKKSSSETFLQKSRFYDSRARSSQRSNSKNDGIEVVVFDEQKPNSKTKINSNPDTTLEGSRSTSNYSDFIKKLNKEYERKNTGNSFSPQPTSGSSKNISSSARTLVLRHGNLGTARPLTSTSPEEQYRKYEINKLTPSKIRDYKSETLGVVGNMLKVTDLYPVVSSLQRQSHVLVNASLSRDDISGALGVGGSRYIPARELISRSGSNVPRYARHLPQANGGNIRSSNNLTQTNVSARASAGLGRAAELSLLNRLRKLERNDQPYVAWQTSDREKSIHSSPNSIIPTRTNGLASVYGGTQISAALERTSNAFRSSSGQHYY